MSEHWAKPFCCLPVVAAKDERLTKTALRVLMVLAYHAHRVTGACTVKLETLATETGLATCKVAAATASLVRLGWLQKVGKGGRSRPVSYYLRPPETPTERVTVTEAVTVTGVVTVTEAVQETPETFTEAVPKTFTEAVKGKEQINYPERKEEKDRISMPPAATPVRAVCPDLVQVASDVHHPPEASVKASHPALPSGASTPGTLDETPGPCPPLAAAPPTATVMPRRGMATAGRTTRRFDEFWAVWPAGYKKDKKTCLATWAAHRLDAVADTILADVIRRREADDGWQRGYIPNPETYLNRERWNDDIRPAVKPPPSAYETAEKRQQRERQAWVQQRQAELAAEEAAREQRHAIN